ncbi:hypothetical protein B0T22DRAFT_293369 [Podospora appendiculata]|uniref:Erythromycin esterase n=1 Tax=Podospora appendiculata TaxID=314037 RepID=A0AAE1C8H0_9PEZI|nr:hypothetical protein B0T22DRAFT_293369 [Podospora appendiculata]
MARRSARLASVTKSPKPSAEPPSLSSVAERDDSPDNGVTAGLDALVSSPEPAPKTPGASSPIKPPRSEMHPSRAHQTMAPPSSGLRLGFTDIRPTSGRDGHFSAAAQTTPSKIGAPNSDFTFRFARETTADLKLGPEAQRMMEELRRDKVEKIKADLKAARDAEKAEEEDANTRKIATAKGKAGRYSAVHMAEFKKMDSIANHPSAFRAQPGRPTTPLKAGVKRSQSKANLEDPEPVRPKQPIAAPTTTTTAVATKAPADNEPVPNVKRARQHMADDASSNRPVSQDGSNLPRPKSSGMGSAIPRSKSSLASLMTPTKSSLARVGTAKTPVPASLLRSPSKVSIGSLTRSATTNNLPTARLEPEKDLDAGKEAEAEIAHVEIKSPASRFDRVKSMLRRGKMTPAKEKSALPLPSASPCKTPTSARAEVPSLAPPMTTPGRKLTKRVAFTPAIERTTVAAALAQNSPSPVKSGIPRSKSRQVLGEVHYPALDAILAEEMMDRGLSYPDLSGEKPLPELPIHKIQFNAAKPEEPSVPGTFTFRSDHTINFDRASPSFGTSPGQASVRPVRPSLVPTEIMPGSFPSSTFSAGPNKENQEPQGYMLAVPHGIKNKKRARASTDEEEAEQEAVEHAAKKQRQETVPEGDQLLAPRLIAASASKRPIGTPRKLSSPRKMMTPGRAVGADSSPTKKRAMISLSRLTALARPKTRK